MSRCAYSTVVVAVAENQLAGMHFADERGLALAAGDWRTLDEVVLDKALARLASDWPLRQRLSAAGRKFIDGRGVERVLDVLLESGIGRAA